MKTNKDFHSVDKVVSEQIMAEQIEPWTEQCQTCKGTGQMPNLPKNEILHNKTMKEYFLKVNNDGSLNGAYLSVWENGTETVLVQSIKEATKKGWKSTKKIFEDLDILQKESDNDLIISEDCALKLLDKYGNVTTKIYTSPNYVPFSAAHAIANFITKNGTDPYDRG